MTFDEWLMQASTLSGAHSNLAGLTESTVSRALIQLHRLICSAPTSLHVAYKRVPEALLMREAERREGRIVNGDYGWTLPPSRSEEDCALAVGSQIRALDRILLTTAKSHLGPPSDPMEWLCSEERVFVVPRKHPRQPVAAKRDGQAYSRRGLLCHRLIPREAHGYEVDLVQHGTIPPVAGPLAGVAPLGAALFSGLNLKIEKSRKGFVVTDAVCHDSSGTVVGQIEAAIAEGCFGIVWPELTVPPQLRGVIADALRGRALETDDRPAPQVVVAGTWHETSRRKVKNVATIFDGYGNITLRYEKFIPYEDKNLGVEKIVPGNKIPVLVTDDQLIAFAICKDFCDLSVNLPYPELDVDLVIVPSMGGDTTMTGHQDTAKKIRVRYGAHTFVVQQADSGHAEGERLGYVLPLLDDPMALKPSDLQQFVTWKSYSWTTTRMGTTS